MKKEEIIITDKTIVLGIFNTLTFIRIKDKGAIPYWRYRDSIPEAYNGIDVLDCVHIASKWAEKIIFILDDVHFPIDPSKSITCGELALICKNEHLFAKTIFVKEDNVINFDRNLVI